MGNLKIFIKKIGNFYKIGRLGMAPLTISVPILGAISSREIILPSELILLGCVGFFAHMFGFIINDCIDQSIDKNVPYRKKSPLLTGKMKTLETLLFAFFQAILAFVLYYFGLRGSFQGLVVLLVSVFLSSIYNLGSKRGKIPRILAEISLALSIGTLSFAGYLANNNRIITLDALFFPLSLTLVLLLVNSIANGIKDVETDEQAGAESFVIKMGCKVRDGRIFISPQTRIYSTSIMLLTLFSFILVGSRFSVNYYLYSLIGILILYSFLHLRYIFTVRTLVGFRKSIPFLYGYYSYFALCIFLVPWMPLLLKIVFVSLGMLSILIPISQSFRMWKSRYTLVT